MNHWIESELGLSDYQISPASEDASFRRYLRLKYNGMSRIVMDAPPSREDCRSFIDIATRLRNCGVNAPEIFNADVKRGFLLLSDFGTTLYLDKLDDENADELYQDALTSLYRMQLGANKNGLSCYSESLLMQEMELFHDWLLEKHLGIKLDRSQRDNLATLYEILVNNAVKQPQVFVHRDYHSRNLIYCDTNNPGIIDFQDAVLGPVTYDLVSLLKDCYIKWPRKQVNTWALNFCNLAYPDQFDDRDFRHWFDLMGVQRHLKASGIFARLFHRDGKAGFLKDIPRTLSYINELEQEYPDLGFLAKLIDSTILPALARKNQSCV